MELGVGFNKPKTAIEENKILAAIMDDANFPKEIKNHVANLQFQRKLEALPENLDRIKATIVDKFPEKFKVDALNNLLNNEISSDTAKHILFNNDFLDANVRRNQVAFKYDEIGNTPLFKEINKTNPSPEQKEKLLNAYRNYVNNNFIEIQVQKNSANKQLGNLIDEKYLVKYLTVMMEIKLDSFGKNPNNSKSLTEKSLKEYNKLLKEEGLIKKDLSTNDMKSLISNFNVMQANNLASSLENTNKEEENKKLISPIADNSTTKKIKPLSFGADGIPIAPSLPPKDFQHKISIASQVGQNKKFDINNLKKITNLTDNESDELSTKLKQYYSMLVEFEKTKAAKQKEENNKRAELARQEKEKREQYRSKFSGS